MKDNIFDKIFLVSVCIVCVLFAYAVVDTASKARENVTELYNKDRATRAQLCRPYYNDGTDQWKECMGVGYK